MTSTFHSRFWPGSGRDDPTMERISGFKDFHLTAHALLATGDDAGSTRQRRRPSPGAPPGQVTEAGRLPLIKWVNLMTLNSAHCVGNMLPAFQLTRKKLYSQLSITRNHHGDQTNVGRYVG